MASKYYNPRLASSVGAAQGEQYVPLEPAIAPARQMLQRGMAKAERNRLIEMERRRKEAEAFEKAMGEREEIAAKTTDKIKKAKYSIDSMPAQSKVLLTLMARDVKDRTRALNAGILNGSIGQAAAVMIRQDIDDDVERMNDIAATMPKIMENYAAAQPSVLNSSKNINISNAIMGGKFELAYSPEKNENGKNKIIAKVTVDGEPLEIPYEDLANPTYAVVDTEAFTTAFKTINDVADKAANDSKSVESMKADVRNALVGLNFTPEQTLSIAFDWLGKTAPGYVKEKYAYLKDYTKDGEIDTEAFMKKIDAETGDGDGEASPEELNEWVHEQLIQAAETAYSSYQKPSAPPTKENTRIIKQGEDYADNFNTAMQSLDFNSIISNMRYEGKPITGYEVKNGKLYLELTVGKDKDGIQVINSMPLDLNNKIDVQRLFRYYVQKEENSSVQSRKILENINLENIFTYDETKGDGINLFPNLYGETNISNTAGTSSPFSQPDPFDPNN